MLCDKDLKEVDQLTYLIGLSLNGKNITPVGIQYLYRLHNLKYIELIYDFKSYQTLNCFQALGQLTLLQSLKLYKIHFLNYAYLKYLSFLKNLKFLILSGCDNVTGDAFVYLNKTFISLISLNIENCKHIVNEGLQAIVDLPSLTNLNLSESSHNFSEESLIKVNRLIYLQSLYLSNLKRITVSAFKYLWQLSDLKQIILYEENNESGLITDELFKILSQCKQLMDISLSHFNISKYSDFETLIPIENLTCLNIYRAHTLSDQFLKYIAKSKKLTRLTLIDGQCITDKGIQHLVNLPLTDLDLRGCTKITDISALLLKDITTLVNLTVRKCTSLTGLALYYFANLLYLKNLYIEACPSMDTAGLFALGSLQSLEMIGISLNDQLTQEAVDLFRKAFPEKTADLF